VSIAVPVKRNVRPGQSRRHKTPFAFLPARIVITGALLVSLWAAPASLPAQALLFYPEIKRLGAGDDVFKQYEEDVREGRRVFSQKAGSGPGKRLSPAEWAELLSLYVYTTRADDTSDDSVLTLASRCNVPQESIATLNRISHGGGIGERTLFLPTVPGIFVPSDADSDMEQLLLSARNREEGVEITVAGAPYLFFPGDEFTATERAFFLTSGRFRFPLDRYTVTSRYGSRVNPISGRVRLHGGLDLAAPMGTDVYASADGVVIECGENELYGKFVIIRHDDRWTSLYGHLSVITARQGGQIRASAVLGKVGSTGQSTGPHLHFELRQNGAPMNPESLLQR
jgi:murein DD-endopeptidase MepM/ murein hydrolase activator NlpD